MRGSGDVAAAKIVTEEAEINHTARRRKDGRTDGRTDGLRTENSDIWRTVDSLGRTRAEADRWPPTPKRKKRGKNPRKSCAAVSHSVSQSIRNYSFMRRERREEGSEREREREQ